MATKTYRYVKVKFAGTFRLYVYRCPFMVRPGDVVMVPTTHGQKTATVASSDPHDHEGFPTAKVVQHLVRTEDGRPLTMQPWPQHFNVRLESGELLTHNQSRATSDTVTRQVRMEWERFGHNTNEADRRLFTLVDVPADFRLTPAKPQPTAVDVEALALSLDDAAFARLSGKMAAEGLARVKRHQEEAERRAREEQREAQKKELAQLEAELRFRSKLEDMREQYRSLLESQSYPEGEVQAMVERMAELHRSLRTLDLAE